MRYISVVLFLVSYSLGPCVGDGDGLSISGVRCGQIMCKRGDYCSAFDSTCKPCLKICEQKSHNFEEALCEKMCQDYLHDSRYVLKDETDGGPNGNLKDTVQRLSRMVTVNLTLVVLMLLVLAAVFIFQFYRYLTKKEITLKDLKDKIFSKRTDDLSNKTTATLQLPNNGKPDLRLEIPTASNPSDSPVTMTTSISRRPAEDSTLDYAYDNPAMATPSPNHHKSAENTF